MVTQRSRSALGPGSTLPRLRALIVLSLLAFVGWQLAVLARSRGPAAPEHQLVLHEGGAALHVTLPHGALRRTGPVPRVVFTRTPLSFDPERSLLAFDDGRCRIVPGNAPTVVVDGRGRVTVLETAVPGGLLYRTLELERGAARAPLTAWFSTPEVVRFFDVTDPRLRDFRQAFLRSR